MRPRRPSVRWPVGSPVRLPAGRDSSLAPLWLPSGLLLLASAPPPPRVAIPAGGDEDLRATRRDRLPVHVAIPAGGDEDRSGGLMFVSGSTLRSPLGAMRTSS